MCKSLTHFYETRAICATDAPRRNESVCLCCNKQGCSAANFMRLLRKAIMLPSCNVKSHFQREAGMNHAPTPSRTRGSRRVKLRAETGFLFSFLPARLRLRTCSLSANTKSNVSLRDGKVAWRAVCKRAINTPDWYQTATWGKSPQTTVWWWKEKLSPPLPLWLPHFFQTIFNKISSSNFCFHYQVLWVFPCW